MPNLTCVRCGETREQMPFQPFQNALGQRVFREICNVCWGEWLRHQQALINHYGLDVRNPDAKSYLFEQMEEFLFGAGETAS